MLDLIDGFSALVGQVLESYPDQHGTADVVSLDARPAALDTGMFNIKAAAGVDFDARDAQHAAAGLVGFCFTSRIKGFPWRPRNDLVPAAVVRQAILEWWGGHHLHGCARNNACPASGRTC